MVTWGLDASTTYSGSSIGGLACARIALTSYSTALRASLRKLSTIVSQPLSICPCLLDLGRSGIWT